MIDYDHIRKCDNPECPVVIYRAKVMTQTIKCPYCTWVGTPTQEGKLQ